VDFVEIFNVYVGKPLRGYLILIRHAAVIVIWVLASLFWNTLYFCSDLSNLWYFLLI